MPEHPLTVKLRKALALEEGDDAIEVVLEQIDEALENPPVPELWGVTEVAACLGIAGYQNVYKKAGLPLPALELQRGQLWLADDIREFAKQSSKGADDGS